MTTMEAPSALRSLSCGLPNATMLAGLDASSQRE